MTIFSQAEPRLMLHAKLRQGSVPAPGAREWQKPMPPPDGYRRYATRQKVTGMRQVMGWKSGLHARPKQARHFYVATAGFTALAIGLNFLGFNPMKALVWSGNVQGFSTPPMLLILR